MRKEMAYHIRSLVKTIGKAKTRKMCLEILADDDQGAFYLREYLFAYNEMFENEHAPTFSSWFTEQIWLTRMTRVEIAKQVGVSHQTVSFWALGQSDPAGRSLFALARVIAKSRSVGVDVIHAEIEAVI